MPLQKAANWPSLKAILSHKTFTTTNHHSGSCVVWCGDLSGQLVHFGPE
jgi:hypothetical protein